MYTPVNHSFTIQKWGLRGSNLYRHVFVMQARGRWRSVSIIESLCRACSTVIGKDLSTISKMIGCNICCHISTKRLNMLKSEQLMKETSTEKFVLFIDVTTTERWYVKLCVRACLCVCVLRVCVCVKKIVTKMRHNFA